MDIPKDELSGTSHSEPFGHTRKLKLAERESEYQRRRQGRLLSPERTDPFATTAQPDGTAQRGYREVLQETELLKEEAELKRKLDKKIKEEKSVAAEGPAKPTASNEGVVVKRRRWDVDEDIQKSSGATPVGAGPSEWETPDRLSSASTMTRGWGGLTPSSSSSEITPKRRRWDDGTAAKESWESAVTPARSDTASTPSRKGSRWDETPVSQGTALLGLATPMGALARGLATPSVHAAAALPFMTPERMSVLKMEYELDARNRPLSDMELDMMIPNEGYAVMLPPSNYVPLRTPGRRLQAATPTPYAGFHIPATPEHGLALGMGLVADAGDAELMKPEDMQYFATLTDGKPDEALSLEEIKERKLMRLLLKLKNGNPAARKSALKQISEKAKDFGPTLLFDKLLPLLMSPSLEDQERHLLVKAIDRILYRLDDMVRPYVHKILVVIEPLLIDEDYYTRVEGREIISNLSKAAGLASMIAAMRPDIDHSDEYVRNTTARAFSVVASALGIPALLPFIRAVCASKKRWEARHTGIKIVQQIAILLGCGTLPHLKALVEAIGPGLEDEQPKVRTITALALSALAEAGAPYGIEAFDSVLKPLWKGIRQHRSKALAAFLKAIGYIIPLMEPEYASYYTKEVLGVLIREFNTPDEEMKKILLKVIQQCVGTDGVTPALIRADLLPDYFRAFWVRRMALDRRNARALIDTTVELATKVGAADILQRIVLDLKDESEPYRKLVMEVIDRVVSRLGSADIDTALEKSLMDGFLFAIQEQGAALDETGGPGQQPVLLNAFGTLVASLGMRVRPYLEQLCTTLLWRLNNKAARVRQQAADLVARLAPSMALCHETKLLNHLSLVLFEYLGEEYPEVLGSILGGLKAIVSVMGLAQLTPPVKDLLPRLTPILKNRHEKVQENTIDLVGRIADRGPESVSPREWMRICFELLDMLKAHKKSIRRAAVNTFGYIAKAIGPQDVLATLLSNLRVQERQLRVCTTVAIAIVAENCAPFTILPALMNEYRVPELNVQNGVLKSLAFLFEYIGEMGKDYIYAITPLLEDALMDRDLVHRQLAANAIKHIALGTVGLGCEDALLHLLNFLWPNVFEASPHVITAVLEAIDGLRVALGPAVMLQYTLQGLFHPARRVREIYWRIYNMLYIGHQDALVPSYPMLAGLDASYQRRELELWL